MSAGIRERAAATPLAEHEFEAEPGLPEPLPCGETLLWQGAPAWRPLAREALHLKLLAIYFGLLLAGRAASVLATGGSPARAAIAVAWLLPAALLALGLLALVAWLIARTTLYTVTNRRVVMRIGVVLTVTFNLPFSKVDGATLRRHADGSGDVALKIAAGDRIAWFHLWPHVRPWRVRQTEPMLRGLADAQQVAALLGEALARSAAGADTDADTQAATGASAPRPMAPPRPRPTPRPALQPSPQPIAASMASSPSMRIPVSDATFDVRSDGLDHPALAA